MKKLLLASAATLAIATSGAIAADLPSRAPAIAPAPMAAPLFTWTGFYIGANAGAAFNGGNRGFTTAGVVPGAVPTAYYGTAFGGGDDTRFTGGAQVGFNWQTGSVVWGLEADINYIDRGDRNNIGVPVGAVLPYAVINGGNRDGNWFGTVRGRLGLGFNRALFYVTGGFAYGANGNNNGTVTYFGAAPCGVAIGGCAFTTTTNDSNIGWTVGGGIEYAFTDSISAKIEYLHVELGRRNAVYSSAAFPGVTFTSRNASRFDVVRAGLNFRFGAFSQAAPVVARY